MTVKTDLLPLRHPRRADRPGRQRAPAEEHLHRRRLGLEAGRRPRRLPRHPARLRADALRAPRRRRCRTRPRSGSASRWPSADGDGYSVAQHARSARLSGLGLDEISLARGFSSSDPKEAALLAFVKGTMDSDGHPPRLPARGGPRSRLDRRAAARGARRGRAERVPEPGRQRGRPAAGPDRRFGPALGRLEPRGGPPPSVRRERWRQRRPARRRPGPPPRRRSGRDARRSGRSRGSFSIESGLTAR